MKAFSSQVKKYLPNDVLHQFVESLEVYKKGSASEQLHMKQGRWKRLVAFGFLYNSDCEKYGKLLKDYKSDYTNNLDHFPEDLVSMRERIPKHVMRRNIRRKRTKKEKKRQKTLTQNKRDHFQQVLHRLQK